MRLRKHDLLQMNAEWLKRLLAERLREVSIRRLDDVKELQDRLNQNPASQAPSKKPGAGEEENEVDEPHLPHSPTMRPNRRGSTGRLRATSATAPARKRCPAALLDSVILELPVLSSRSRIGGES